MAGWPDGADVEESSLRLGRELGSGGQGVVRVVIGHPLVYKQYRVAGADPEALRRLVELPASLQSAEREQLRRSTAWPLARVVRGGQLSGFLMPEIPDCFRGPNAIGTSKLRELQYLLYPSRPLWGAIVPPGLPFGIRVEVAIEFARILSLLHAKSLVVGDISMSNVLWAPGSPARIFVIDCDGIRMLGSRPVLRQAETPDWGDPQQPGSGPDLDSDRYKLALLVVRVLSAAPYPRPDGGEPALPAEVPARIADRVRHLWRQAGGSRGTRPDAAQWLGALTGRPEIPLAPPRVRTRPAIPMTEIEDTRGKRPTITMRPADDLGTAPWL